MTGLLWAGRATLSDPASRIPPEKFAVLNRAALDACDARDGVTDGVIENPRSCRFDPQVVACTRRRRCRLPDGSAGRARRGRSTGRRRIREPARSSFQACRPAASWAGVQPPAGPDALRDS